MWRRLVQCVIIAALVGHESSAWAEYAAVEIAKPFHARHLAGVALDPSGAPVEAVVVEECDSTSSRVLSTTVTDAKGRFSLPQGKSGSVHYLSLRARGFNPLRVTVSLRRFAKSGVRLSLPIGG